VRARDCYRIGIDSLSEQPFALGLPNPELFRDFGVAGIS
jgi:hypothetical protein